MAFGFSKGQTAAAIIIPLCLALMLSHWQAPESASLSDAVFDDLGTAGIQLLQKQFKLVTTVKAAASTQSADGKSKSPSSLLSIKAEVTAGSGVQQVMQWSSAIAELLAKAAKASPAASVTRDLFESFQICGQCSTFQRFGEANDGGYLMCMDGLNKDTMKAAYSLGVEHHDQWSEDVISHFGVAVNQFDCTVESSSCQGCRFFKKCISSADGEHPLEGHEQEMLTLHQVLTETNQADAPDGSLLMKMDIEASEWPIFAKESPESLKKIGQLVVEFHWLNKEELHPMYLQAMQHILASGFKIAHLHGNNNGDMYQKGGDSIPNVIEATFVHSASRPQGCAKTQEYEQLDASNVAGGTELPMARLD